MPVVFVGHGSPMNALPESRWGQAWRTLGRELPRPRAYLVVSAHWYVAGTFVTGNQQPPTIHDFGGFPRELYQIRYPADGAPDLAREVAALLAGWQAAPREDWGLDHGTWSVLRHLRPEADVPVVQLAIDRRLPPGEHLAIGAALAPLRDDGVLVLASGNLVHNLAHAFRYLGQDADTPGWAARFDDDLVAALERRDHGFLAAALETPDGRLAHPSPDHYLPLLYAAGAAGDDEVAWPVVGFDASSLSMRCARWR
jgi:4,5-DOPA dioxygenase extradiol